MLWYRNLSMIPKIILPISITLIVTLGILTWQIQSKSSDIIEQAAEQELAALAGQYGNEVKSIFDIALSESQAQADAVSYLLDKDAAITRQLIIQIMTGILEGNKKFTAVGGAWEPNALDGSDEYYANRPGNDENGRFIPYLAVGAELDTLEDVDEGPDYAEPKKNNKGYLTDPFLYNVAGQDIMIATCAAPVRRNGNFVGIMFVDLSLVEISNMVNAIKIYESGWGALLTQDGTIVTHKNHDLIEKSIFDTGQVGNAKELKANMLKGEPFMEIHPANGVQNFYYYYPIYFESTGQNWYFVVCAPIDEVLDKVAIINRLTLWISLGVLIISIFIIYLVVRACAKPLGILSGAAKEIADGNLNLVVDDTRFGGEIKELSSSFKEMIASLIENISKAEAMSEDAKSQTIKAQQAMREAEAARVAAENAKSEGMHAAANQLEDAIGIIASASEQLAAQIDQSERGAGEQAARMADAATAMEEMNSTVNEVARNASSASQISLETRSIAEEGEEIVQKAVSSIRNVHQQSQLLKEDMSTLSDHAQSINEIMRVISDIADQTNLLALNAAIEAARAGDAGRGFAVVADEVRKLAENTMLATSNVSKAILSIQESASKNMHQVDLTVANIEDATKLSDQSGDVLKKIVGMVDSTADQVGSIATASEEQAAASEEINRSINGVNSIAAETANAMREASKAITDLAAQAQHLNELVHEMKEA